MKPNRPAKTTIPPAHRSAPPPREASRRTGDSLRLPLQFPNTDTLTTSPPFSDDFMAERIQLTQDRPDIF